MNFFNVINDFLSPLFGSDRDFTNHSLTPYVQYKYLTVEVEFGDRLFDDVEVEDENFWIGDNGNEGGWSGTYDVGVDMITFDDNRVAEHHEMHSEAAMAAARAQIVCNEANQHTSHRVNWQKEGF